MEFAPFAGLSELAVGQSLFLAVIGRGINVTHLDCVNHLPQMGDSNHLCTRLTTEAAPFSLKNFSLTYGDLLVSQNYQHRMTKF